MLIGRYSHARMAPPATVGPRPPPAGSMDRARPEMPVSEAVVVAGSVAAIGAAVACARRSRRAPGGGWLALAGCATAWAAAGALWLGDWTAAPDTATGLVVGAAALAMLGLRGLPG